MVYLYTYVYIYLCYCGYCSLFTNKRIEIENLLYETESSNRKHLLTVMDQWDHFISYKKIRGHCSLKSPLPTIPRMWPLFNRDSVENLWFSGLYYISLSAAGVSCMYCKGCCLHNNMLIRLQSLCTNRVQKMHSSFQASIIYFCNHILGNSETSVYI